MLHFTKAAAVSTLGAVAIAGFGFTPALAQEDQYTEQVARFIDEVRPDEVANEAVTPDGVTEVSEGGSTVSIPVASDGLLTLKGESGVDISVVLPGEGSPAAIAADGTVVYADEAGVSVAVQAESGVARVHTVMQGPEDVEDTTYVFPDLTPELNRDGSVTLFATAGNGSFEVSVGYVEAPWAADAEGDALDTHYRVEGNALIQEVTIDGDTAFPVVSDPAFQGDCGIVTCTIRFDRQWTKKIRDYGGDTALIVGALVGAGFSLGGPVGAAVGAAAGVIVGARGSIFSKQAGDFLANGNCFGIKWNPVPTSVGWGTEVKRKTQNCY